jgi:NitT/TauT family transport system substrate-binding protein
MKDRKPSLYQLSLMILVAVLLLVGVSLVVLNLSGNSQLLRVAYHPDLHGAGIMVLAEEKGFFKDEGLRVELVKFLSGPPEIQAMASGDIDIAYLGMGAHFYAAQGRCKILAIDSLNLGDMVIAHRDSGIKGLRDLRGKRIGVPRGTSGEMILSLALDQAKLRPEEVRIVNMDVAGAVAAFVARKIDVVALWVPYTTEIERQVGKENVIRLADNARFIPEYAFLNSWVTTERFLKRHPGLAVKFMRAWARANDYRYHNLEETVGLTSQFTQMPEGSLRMMVRSTQWLESRAIATYFQDGTAAQWYENQEGIFVKTGKLARVVAARRFLRPEPLLRALGRRVKE